MKYVYILLISLILLYLISRYYEKYYSQENFDPSLVPVSSIITLAKASQKILDGNGTLTNPVNLQIGIPSAKGNLTVTGNKQVDGTLGVGGATSIGGTLGVAGATTVGGTLGVTNATTVSGTLGVTGLSNLNGGLKVTNNISTTGTLAVGGTDSQGYTLGVGGTLGITGNTGVDGNLGIAGLSTLNNNATIGKSEAIGTKTPTATNLTVNGAEYITGNSKITGTLNVTGNIISNTLKVPTVNVGSSLNINARNNTAAKPVAGYTLSSDDGKTLIVAQGKDIKFSIDQFGNVNIIGNLTINGTTLSNVNQKLNISKPIVNNNPELDRASFSDPTLLEYPQVTVNEKYDGYISFYKQNNIPNGWLGSKLVKLWEGLIIPVFSYSSF